MSTNDRLIMFLHLNKKLFTRAAFIIKYFIMILRCINSF